MPDPTPAPVPAPLSPAPAPNPVDPSVITAVQDVASDVPLAKQIITDFKTGGPAGAAKDLPQVLAALSSQLADFKAAVPAIKAGYKTTEFWLVLAVIAGNAGYVALTKKTLPIDVNVVLGAVVAIYTAARSLVKKPAA
jgi:hypothetical protein